MADNDSAGLQPRDHRPGSGRGDNGPPDPPWKDIDASEIQVIATGDTATVRRVYRNRTRPDWPPLRIDASVTNPDAPAVALRQAKARLASIQVYFSLLDGDGGTGKLGSSQSSGDEPTTGGSRGESVDSAGGPPTVLVPTLEYIAGKEAPATVELQIRAAFLGEKDATGNAALQMRAADSAKPDVWHPKAGPNTFVPATVWVTGGKIDIEFTENPKPRVFKDVAASHQAKSPDAKQTRMWSKQAGSGYHMNNTWRRG